MALAWHIFANNVLPAFLVMGVGVLLERSIPIDKRTLSRLAIYVLTPCLVFSSIVQSEVDPGQFGLMVIYVVVYTMIMCSVGLGAGVLLRWAPKAIKGLVLSVAFTNSGNLGLFIVLATFGQAGFGLGAAYFVATTLVTNTFAAFVAAHGRGTLRQTLLQVLRLPGIYAFGLALLLRGGPSLPDVIMRPISLIAQAQIPIMLMMLGIQLSQTQIARQYRQVSVGVALRLLGGAGVAIVLAPLMGLTGLARQVAIAQSSTPAAVSTALMAIEFDAEADYVASVIFFSTLLSSLTLSVLLSALVG